MENFKMVMFENFNVRSVYDEKQEKWYFSIVDIIAILTQQTTQRGAAKYWSVLKLRLKQEGSQLTTNCSQLKMQAADGKFYDTDAADVETLLRLIQSVPSPKAEPIKLWLAKVGYERMQEIADPEKSLNRARENWQKHGRSQKWIQQRMMGQETRNKLTDYWKDHGVKEGDEFAMLTNIIHKEWSDLTVKQHKQLKGLKSQNLRDHMNEAELIFTALAELTTREIAQKDKAVGFAKNKSAGVEGGKFAKDARIKFEERTGKKVVANDNFLPAVNIKAKELAEEITPGNLLPANRTQNKRRR